MVDDENEIYLMYDRSTYQNLVIRLSLYCAYESLALRNHQGAESLAQRVVEQERRKSRPFKQGNFSMHL